MKGIKRINTVSNKVLLHTKEKRNYKNKQSNVQFRNI